MLKSDEQLYEETRGQVGDSLEKAILQLKKGAPSEEKEIWGSTLPLHSILIDVERAAQFVEALVTNYWGELNLFLLDDLADSNVDVDQMNGRLQQFFQSANGKDRLFQYVKQNHTLRYDHFLTLVFDKEIKADAKHTGLTEIILFPVKDKFILQGIYTECEVFWRTLYAKKIYSVLRECKLAQIESPVHLFNTYKELLAVTCTKNRIASIIYKHVMEMDYENPKSFELKQLHLLNIINHYSSGRRYINKLKKCIEQFTASWSHGDFALTEKERTLLAFISFMRATLLRNVQEQLIYARFLLEDDRISEHSVELFLEFGTVLGLARPQPDALVKNYTENYLEYLFYLMLNAFVERGHYDEAMELLKQYEMASCVAVHRVINGQTGAEQLAAIEATVQRDITNVTNHAPQQMMEAIRYWRENYKIPTSKYGEITAYTVRHLSNILKTLFVYDQYDGFEKLMEVYKKYLELPQYTVKLHRFLVEHVEQESERLHKV